MVAFAIKTSNSTVFFFEKYYNNNAAQTCPYHDPSNGFGKIYPTHITKLCTF